MDFSTSHTAYTLHAQEAQRAAVERERQRIMQERAAERGEGIVDVPIPRQPALRALAALLRGRRTAAQ